MADGKAGAPIGNQNGLKARRWASALERALAEKFGSVDDGLKQIATAVVRDAHKGDVVAWQEIANRMDGKHAQPITGDSTGEPIQIVITPVQAAL